MNKKEQAAMNEAIRAAQVNRALRWTDHPEAPDVPVPESGKRSVGYLFNPYTRVVSSAWSDCNRHGYGRPPIGSPASASQRGVQLFSTPARAAAAMRRDLERKYAAALAEIDRMIAGLPDEPNEA